MIERIKWLGHGSFLIEGPPIIYIDPWRVARKAFFADAILVSHDHYDHCSVADINKLRGPDTLVLTNELVSETVEDCEILRPWQSRTLERGSVKAVPAYSPTHWQHPLSNGGLGFVISINLFDIYYAGDTQRIPEMDLIKPDIAILPIDGNGTLNIEDAVTVVRDMRPRWVIPCNYGQQTEGGSAVDARSFQQEASKYAEVILLDETV